MAGVLRARHPAAGGTQSRLGIDQEVRRGDDPLTFGKPLEYLHAIAGPRPHDHLVRMQRSVGVAVEDEIPHPRLDHRVRRYRQHVLADVRIEVNGGVHPRFEAQVRIGDGQSHAIRPAPLVDGWIDEADPAHHVDAGIGGDLDVCLGAFTHELEILLEHVAFHPHRREIGDSVETHPRHHLLPLQHLLLQHDAVHRCHQRERLRDRAGFFHSGDLVRRDVPVSQTPARRLERRLGVAPGFAGRRVDLGCQAPGREQLFLGRNQHRAVERQERLAASHRLARRADVQLLDEPIDLRRDVRDVGLGCLDPPHRSNRPGERFATNRRIDDAERALLIGGEVHRLPQHPAGRVGRARSAGLHSRVLLRGHPRHRRLLFTRAAPDERGGEHQNQNELLHC